MWRARLRISEAPELSESAVDEARGAILVRHGASWHHGPMGL